MTEFQNHWIVMDAELQKLSESSSNTEMREKSFISRYLKDLGSKNTNPKVIQERLSDGRSVRIYIWMNTLLGNVGLVTGRSVEPSLKYLIEESVNVDKEDVDLIIPRSRQESLVSVSIPLYHDFPSSISSSPTKVARTKRNKPNPITKSSRTKPVKKRSKQNSLINSFSQFTRDNRFHNPLKRKNRKNPIKVTSNSFGAGISSFLPHINESLALGKFISQPVLQEKDVISKTSLQVEWSSDSLKKENYRLFVLYELKKGAGDNYNELSLSFFLTDMNLDYLWQQTAILDGEDVDNWKKAWQSLYSSVYPVVLTNMQEYIDNPSAYEPIGKSLETTQGKPTLEDMQQGEAIIQTEKPVEEIVIKEDGDPQVFPDSGITSKQFIHKETGDIVTQVPIMELDMYEEYTGQDMKEDTSLLQSPLPYLEQLKLLSSRSLLSSSDSKFLKKALKERIERDFGKAVAKRIKLSVQNKMTGSTKASLLIQGKCEKNEDRLAVAKCLRTLGYQSTFSMEDGVGTLESNYLGILEWSAGLDGAEEYLGLTYVYPLEHKVYADITDEIDLNFDECLSMIKSVLNKNKPIEEKLEEQQTDVGLNVLDPTPIAEDDETLDFIDSFTKPSPDGKSLKEKMQESKDEPIPQEDKPVPLEIEIFDPHLSLSAEGVDELVEMTVIEGYYGYWEDYIARIDDDSFTYETNFFNKGNIKLTTEQYDFLIHNLQVDLNNNDVVNIDLASLRDKYGKKGEVTYYDESWGKDGTVEYANMFMIYADDRNPFYISLEAQDLYPNKIARFIIEWENPDWTPFVDVSDINLSSEHLSSEQMTAVITPYDILRKMLSEEYSLVFEDSEWEKVKENINDLVEKVYEDYFSEEKKSKFNSHMKSKILDEWMSYQQFILNGVSTLLRDIFSADPNMNKKGFLLNILGDDLLFEQQVASILYSQLAYPLFPLQVGEEIWVKSKYEDSKPIFPVVVKKIIIDLSYKIPAYKITASLLNDPSETINFVHFPENEESNKKSVYYIVDKQEPSIETIGIYDDWWIIITVTGIEVSPKANTQEKFLFVWESDAQLLSAMKAILEGSTYTLGNLEINSNNLSQVYKGNYNLAKIKETYIPYFVDELLQKANLTYTAPDGTTYGVKYDSEPVLTPPTVSTPTVSTVYDPIDMKEILTKNKGDTFLVYILKDTTLESPHPTSALKGSWYWVSWDWWIKNEWYYTNDSHLLENSAFVVFGKVQDKPFLIKDAMDILPNNTTIEVEPPQWEYNNKILPFVLLPQHMLEYNTNQMLLNLNGKAQILNGKKTSDIQFIALVHDKELNDINYVWLESGFKDNIIVSGVLLQYRDLYSLQSLESFVDTENRSSVYYLDNDRYKFLILGYTTKNAPKPISFPLNIASILTQWVAQGFLSFRFEDKEKSLYSFQKVQIDFDSVTDFDQLIFYSDNVNGDFIPPREAVEENIELMAQQSVETPQQVASQEQPVSPPSGDKDELIEIFTAPQLASKDDGAVFYIPNSDNDYESSVAFKLLNELYILDEDGFVLAEPISDNLISEELGGKLIYVMDKPRDYLIEVGLDADLGTELIAEVLTHAPQIKSNPLRKSAN